MDLLILFALGTILVALVCNARDLRRKLDELLDRRSVVLQTADLEALMENELERARRLNYPLSVITIRPDEHGARKSASNTVLANIADRAARGYNTGTGINFFRRAKEPSVRLRSTDVAVYDKQQSSIIVLLIGAAKVDAEKVAERISVQIADLIQEPLQYGCAEFPHDKYIFEDLIRDSRPSRACSGNLHIGSRRQGATTRTDAERA